MKIYTKKGDQGKTALIGGSRVPKYHTRIESYGTVDELNAHIGLIRDVLEHDVLKKRIIRIQDRLFTLGSLLAAEPGKSKMQLPELTMADIEMLESAIDEMNENLPEMRNFVLPGGHPHVSHCHIARCVCRRAERAIVLLSEEEEIPELAIAYINRLSDFLFVLSRYLTQSLGAVEIPWIPEK